MDQRLAQAIIDECVGNAHGNLARVTELVDQHPDVVNARATWNETPIEAATQMANRPIIEFLVARGAPVDFFTACVLGEIGRVRDELAAEPALALAREGARIAALDVARPLAYPGYGLGTPDDLVGMCLFLLSDEARWITAQIFNVDGGLVFRPSSPRWQDRRTLQWQYVPGQVRQ